MEVLDCLVDLALRFEGPYKKAADEGEQRDTPFLLPGESHDVVKLLLVQASVVLEGHV